MKNTTKIEDGVVWRFAETQLFVDNIGVHPEDFRKSLVNIVKSGGISISIMDTGFSDGDKRGWPVIFSEGSDNVYFVDGFLPDTLKSRVFLRSEPFDVIRRIVSEHENSIINQFLMESL